MTIEAIGPRGESATLSFPILVSSAPNLTGNTEIQRIADGGWTIRTIEEKKPMATSSKEEGNNESVGKSASIDKTEDMKIEKSFGFFFFIALIALVLLGFIGLKMCKIRNRRLHNRGLRHVELPEWNGTDDVETLRSRYYESNRDEVRSVA